MNFIKNILLLLPLMLFTNCKKTTSEATSEKITADSTANVKPKLEKVFSDSTYQLTGVAVAGYGRLFTNYPYWLPEHENSVVEVVNGIAIPYPNVEWNSFKKGEDGQNKFVCVQAVVTDDKDFLWVVDAAGIGLGKVYQNSNKILKINLKTNKIDRIYRFKDSGMGDDLYINDIRVDNKNGFAYMSNSSTGGIVVLNLESGASKLVLANSSSVKSDPTYIFSPLGTELKSADGKPLKINSDGIALTPDKEYIYYKPLSDNNLYRIKTNLLRDFKASEKTLESAVENLGKFTTTDGMIFDKKGNLYLGDIEKSSIVKITPDLKMKTIIQDKEKLIWPDSYSISPDGYLYISTSQIQYSPMTNAGEGKFKRPFSIYRIKI
ncbi:L-dopachrome tautomerase-related protein [Halpernia frigidisoli]|uniref:Major royal jelly protein n=1 Tax=Halpernia frigidisoli TaxID=1125876 RepID=A0A1I3HVZ7_9FLAO|nr:L-dopachrome tautomerase-related protein [Halpernia frigidisoli]SFI39926.1 Major royal jelly protein [Halpernia frigidisoli]